MIPQCYGYLHSTPYAYLVSMAAGTGSRFLVFFFNISSHDLWPPRRSGALLSAKQRTSFCARASEMAAVTSSNLAAASPGGISTCRRAMRGGAVVPSATSASSSSSSRAHHHRRHHPRVASRTGAAPAAYAASWGFVGGARDDSSVHARRLDVRAYARVSPDDK